MKFEIGDIVVPAPGWHSSWYRFKGIVINDNPVEGEEFLHVLMFAKTNQKILLNANNFILHCKNSKFTRLICENL